MGLTPVRSVPGSATPPAVDFKLTGVRWQWIAAVPFLVAIILRLYHLGADPLWLDELISTQVVRRGLLAVFANSQTDPHPPLYYLLLWFTSGFGAAQAEWAWRWPSALAGALSVPALYRLARRTAGEVPAMLVAIWLAISPTAVYFSQEARWPAVTLLLAIVLTLVFFDLLSHPAPGWRWVLYAGLAAAGLFTSYSFLLVAGMQLPFVLRAVRREPGGWRLALTLVGSHAMQAVLGFGVLPAIAAEHANSQPLSILVLLAQLLAGDIFRYGIAWPHFYLVALLVGLSALGLWHLVSAKPKPAWTYAPLQVAAPLAVYGLVLSPLLHLNLPTYETRQFLVLMPMLFVLCAHGLAQFSAKFPRAVGWSLSLIISAVVVAGSIGGLARYWAKTRSPEGQAAAYVAHQLVPGDALIALDRYSAMALSYYLPDWSLFSQPTLTETGLRLLQPDGRLAYEDPPELAYVPLSAVRAHQRLWVFSTPGLNEAVVDALLAGCHVDATADISWLPIRVQLLTGCAADTSP